MGTRQVAQLDESAVSQLACPACMGDLRLEAAHLLCLACGHVFPVVDGIPVLIADRDKTLPARR